MTIASAYVEWAAGHYRGSRPTGFGGLVLHIAGGEVHVAADGGGIRLSVTRSTHGSIATTTACSEPAELQSWMARARPHDTMREPDILAPATLAALCPTGRVTATGDERAVVFPGAESPAVCLTGGPADWTVGVSVRGLPAVPNAVLRVDRERVRMILLLAQALLALDALPSGRRPEPSIGALAGRLESAESVAIADTYATLADLAGLPAQAGLALLRGSAELAVRVLRARRIRRSIGRRRVVEAIRTLGLVVPGVTVVEPGRAWTVETSNARLRLLAGVDVACGWAQVALDDRTFASGMFAHSCPVFDGWVRAIARLPANPDEPLLRSAVEAGLQGALLGRTVPDDDPSVVAAPD